MKKRILLYNRPFIISAINDVLDAKDLEGIDPNTKFTKKDMYDVIVENELD